MLYSETALLKVNFRSVPSHASSIVAPFSLPITYKGQNWMARL